MSKEMTIDEALAASQKLYGLLNRGIPYAEAFKQAFPNGLPTKQDQLKKAAKAQQQAGVAQTGGLVGGALAGKVAVDAATGSGWFAPGAASAAGTAGTTGAAAAAPAAAEAALPVATAGTEAATGTLGTLGSGAAYALPALAVALGGRTAYKMATGQNKAWEDSSAADKVGRVILGMATGGLSELGNKLLGQKSTKQMEADRWGALGPQAQELYQAAHPENDNGQWANGEQWTMDKAIERAKANPDEFRGVYGNMATFKDWLTYTPEQQRAIVTGALNENLYKSDHGDIMFTDPERAKQIAASVLGGQTPQGMQPISPGLADALAPVQKPQIDAGTLRRWRMGHNG